MSALERFQAAYFAKMRCSPSKSCLCPAHNDTNPSLSVSVTNDGKLLLKCFAGCSYEAILESLGLKPNDLHNGNGKTKQKKQVAVYEYWDELKQKILFEIVRYEPKAFRARHVQESNGEGVCIWEAPPKKDWIPYNLPAVLNAREDGTEIWIVAGEKDANALIKRGYVATCNPFGEGKWFPQYNSHFKGASSVVIVADKDDAGYRHAKDVYENLKPFFVDSIRIVEAKEGKDTFEHFAKGYSVGDFVDISCSLDSKICGEQKISSSDSEADAPREEIPDGFDDPDIVWLKDVTPKAVEYLWKPYIPKGKITIVEGDMGVGKSFVVLAIASTVTNGGKFPLQEKSCSQGNVLLFSAEDDLDDTVRPRFDRLEGNNERLACSTSSLSLKDDCERLRTLLSKYKPELVIFDVMQAYLTGVDFYRANETRPVFQKLKELAEEFGTSILLVRHDRKSHVGRATDAGMGSKDIGAAARSIILVGEDKDKSTKDRLVGALVHIKCNNARKGESIGYIIEDVNGEGNFGWTGISDITAENILNFDAESSPIDDAEDFLKQELSDGAQPSKDVQKRAGAEGISLATLRRAKKRIGIKSVKKEKGWVWELNQDAHPCENEN